MNWQSTHGIVFIDPRNVIGVNRLIVVKIDVCDDARRRKTAE